MNPLHWLFARIYYYILVLKPDATSEKMPEATLLVLNMFLLFPLMWVILLAEEIVGFQGGTVGTVLIWLGACWLMKRHLLAKETAHRVLTNYPVPLPTKAVATAFFASLVLGALVFTFLPVP